MYGKDSLRLNRDTMPNKIQRLHNLNAVNPSRDRSLVFRLVGDGC